MPSDAICIWTNQIIIILLNMQLWNCKQCSVTAHFFETTNSAIYPEVDTLVPGKLHKFTQITKNSCATNQHPYAIKVTLSIASQTCVRFCIHYNATKMSSCNVM